MEPLIRTTEIPFEKQSSAREKRDCGAACLAMVYKALGKDVPADEIWPKIAKKNANGSISSTTHLMALDAIDRGLRVVTVQARHPLPTLKQCTDFGIHAVLNLRLNKGSAAGHYCVLTGMDQDSIEVHDPLLGPSQRLSRLELLELWTPALQPSEITGHVLLAIAPGTGNSSAPAYCLYCHAPVPAEVTCPACKKPAGLRPRATLGCVSDECPGRLWQQVCCPNCDCLWDFAPGTDSSRTMRGADLGKVFAAVDKFSAFLSAIPGAGERQDIKAQLDQLARAKDQLRTALPLELAHRTLLLGQLNNLRCKSAALQIEQQKRASELKKPLPPLDGYALGRALLKNLGMIT